MKERYLLCSRPFIKECRNKINYKIWSGNQKANDEVAEMCVCLCMCVCVCVRQREGEI